MRIIIVTGASAGMGREALLQLADRFGSIEEVWAIARRKERLEELSGSITARLRPFALDLNDPASIRVLSDELKARQPKVLFLVNAAGIGTVGPLVSQDGTREADMIRLNCMALTAVTRAVLPYMEPNGRILEFSSASAFLPQPGFTVYAATKAYVLSYSRALNYELGGSGIRVTAVCPGPVKTEFFDEETFRSLPLYKRLFFADKKAVVRTAVRDSMAGKSVSVYGAAMKLFFLACKVIPHEWILKAVFGRGGKV